LPRRPMNSVEQTDARNADSRIALGVPDCRAQGTSVLPVSGDVSDPHSGGALTPSSASAPHAPTAKAD
jgi:hypothetical protein